MRVGDPRLRFLTCLGNTSFHQMAWWQWGSDHAARTIICVHGLTRNGRDFDGLAPILVERGYRVICPDIVGRGKSDWLSNPADYGYSQYLRDMATLLAVLGGGPVDWLGTSMGGMIGMMLAATPGHPIRHLIINDVGAVIPVAALRRIAEYVGLDPIFTDITAAEQYVRRVMAPFGLLNDDQWRHLTMNSMRERADGGLSPAYDPGIATPFQGQLPDTDIDLWPIWHQIIAPSLIIRGQNSDLLLPDTVAAMCATRQNVSALEFADCGHAPMLWDPAQQAPILTWLTQQGA